MEITGKLSFDIQSEEILSSQYEKSIDDQYYITVNEDSDDDDMIHETTNIDALETSSSHYYSTMLYSQGPNSIHINTNGVNHAGPVRTNTYLYPINVGTLNQESPVIPVSKQT